MYCANTELTKELYDKYELESVVKKHSCYPNCFNALQIDGLFFPFVNNKLRIALCYADSNNFGIWVRHCVIVNEKDEIIDFSIYSLGRDLSEVKYKIVKVFEHGEYIDNVVNNDNRCDFPMLKEEYDFYIKEKTENPFFQLNENDYFEFIIPLLHEYGYPDCDVDTNMKSMLDKLAKQFQSNE